MIIKSQNNHGLIIDIIYKAVKTKYIEILNFQIQTYCEGHL
jgi:hypothetical protein